MFHKPLDVGSAGQNVGLLLRGIKHDQVRRGEVVTVEEVEGRESRVESRESSEVRLLVIPAKAGIHEGSPVG